MVDAAEPACRTAGTWSGRRHPRRAVEVIHARTELRTPQHVGVALRAGVPTVGSCRAAGSASRARQALPAHARTLVDDGGPGTEGLALAGERSSVAELERGAHRTEFGGAGHAWDADGRCAAARLWVGRAGTQASARLAERGRKHRTGPAAGAGAGRRPERAVERRPARGGRPAEARTVGVTSVDQPVAVVVTAVPTSLGRSGGDGRVERRTISARQPPARLHEVAVAVFVEAAWGHTPAVGTGTRQALLIDEHAGLAAGARLRRGAPFGAQPQRAARVAPLAGAALPVAHAGPRPTCSTAACSASATSSASSPARRQAACLTTGGAPGEPSVEPVFHRGEARKKREGREDENSKAHGCSDSTPCADERSASPTRVLQSSPPAALEAAAF